MVRVMIVDDAAFMRLTIRNMLLKNGFVVVAEAENGADAIAKFSLFKPDIITMDITMPVMDGLSALKEIKKLSNTTKIVMVSALGQEAMVRDAVLSGASGFIVKPYKEEAIVETLRKLA